MRSAPPAWLRVALFALALGLVAWLSWQWPLRVDLGQARRASLAPESRAALGALHGRLEIVSYARSDSTLRGAIAAFIDRYRGHGVEIDLRFVDPDRDPGAMRERGLRVDGELELALGTRRQRLTELNERAFTGALLRLARPAPRLIAFLQGHGERRPDQTGNHDLARFAQALAQQDVRSVSLNLATEAGIPQGVDVLALAAPAVALAAAEVATLLDFVERGGTLWLLLEPETPAAVEDSLAPLLDALGVRRLPGTVVDATAQGLGIGDPSFVAITSYPAHASTRDFALTVLLPQAAAFGRLDELRFAMQPVLRSGERSWTESGPIADAIAYDAGGSEIPGPHDLALALTRLSPSPDRREQRVLLLGDADFLADRWLGNGGNLALGLRLANWLTGDDALADLAAPGARDRVLALTPRQLAWLGALYLVFVPLGLALAGGVIAWRRRRR